MAKQQSFSDKAKSKARSEYTFFKAVYAVEENGTVKFRQRMVRVKDPKDIDTMKF